MRFYVLFPVSWVSLNVSWSFLFVGFLSPNTNKISGIGTGTLDAWRSNFSNWGTDTWISLGIFIITISFRHQVQNLLLKRQLQFLHIWPIPLLKRRLKFSKQQRQRQLLSYLNLYIISIYYLYPSGIVLHTVQHRWRESSLQHAAHSHNYSLQEKVRGRCSWSLCLSSSPLKCWFWGLKILMLVATTENNLHT